MKPQESGIKTFKQIRYNLAVAILLIGIAIVFLGCEPEIEKIKAFSSSENLPLVSATDFETTFIDSFKVQFCLKAPTLRKFDTGGQPFFEFPDGILLIKYDQNENVISRITADYAIQYEKQEKWEAKNNVVAVNAQGDTLKTELLIWDEKAGKIFSDKFVRIVRTDQIITGVGFEADQSLQNWKIKNPKGTIYVELEKEEGASYPEDSTAHGNERQLKPLEFK